MRVSQTQTTCEDNTTSVAAGLQAQINALSAPTVTTWAGKPSASSAGAGGRIIVTDVGSYRTDWISDGSVWRPMNGRVTLATLSSNVTSVTGITEQILKSVALPAGMLIAGCTLRLGAATLKSGTAETSTVRVRIGSTGTTSDQIVMAPTMATTVDGLGMFCEFHRASATTMLRTGAGGNTTLFPMGTSNASQTTAVTVANMDTTANTIIITSQYSASVETTTLNQYILELIA